MQLVIKESKNLAVAAKQVWQRLNGVSPTKEEELTALQKESAALLSLRGEATKLRSGIRLVQRQKELKASYLIRRAPHRSALTRAPPAPHARTAHPPTRAPLSPPRARAGRPTRLVGNALWVARRSDGDDLLEETLRADVSIAKLQKELSLKVIACVAVGHCR